MEKIKNLKKILIREKIDGYLIPKNDDHFNEYISDQNDRLKYISNFSGSYGFALILKNKNFLFVDGRYSLQALNQSGKFFKICTLPKITPYKVLKNKKLVIGFDPKLFSQGMLNFFFKKTSCTLKAIDKNLVDEIWKRKIKQNSKKFYILPKNSAVISYNTKIKKVLNFLKKKNADFQFITASENNAWLLNIRGEDAKYSPIPLSYILIEKNKKIIVFCDLKKIPTSFKKHFRGIKFIDLISTGKILSEIKNKRFVTDKNTCSYYFEKTILKNNKILDIQDPIYNFKAIKNKKEIKNIKDAHIYDGAALTKYLFWIKNNFNKKKISEISGSEKLNKFRKKNSRFKFSSFPTISGSGPNGAIIHYKADKKSNRILKNGDLYLVDSGGQYNYGTTDVTRTISLNNSSKKIKNIFTRVLKGHIAVSNYKIKKNTTGSDIDFEARKYLKEIGLDYSHGTGHGVGYFLNVHEGPQAISKYNKIKFNEGMVVSNEPGFYRKNEYGIRIENLLFVNKKKDKRYFENLTMVPIDKNLIDENLLNENEKKWLNNYHNKVFWNLKRFMNKFEVRDLENACSAI